ncbi:hypothetical protein ISN44_Un16g000090 [Arabidopsis suecica]|uniref:Uncharacterized protein n=1 Tax=Arabidopsis suecica TaxID=45249 RepID=A0A8T1XCS2_ARASU|nr:hypothetical protein ISN44_Un16g000090 [Arabidopsis suecica]
MKLKESLLDKEEDLKNVTAEISSLREWEGSVLEKSRSCQRLRSCQRRMQAWLMKQPNYRALFKKVKISKKRKLVLKKIEELSVANESLADNVTDLQSIVQESKDLKEREVAYLKKIEELSVANESLVDKETKLQHIDQEAEELRGREASHLKKMKKSKDLREREVAYLKKIDELSTANGTLADNVTNLQNISEENKELRERETTLLKKAEELSELNESLVDKASKLQTISNHEKEELKERETAYLKKIEELSKVQEDLLNKENELHENELQAVVCENEELKSKQVSTLKTIDELSDLKQSLIHKEKELQAAITLIDKQNELQGVFHENEELKAKEASSLKKIDELLHLEQSWLEKESEFQRVTQENLELKTQDALAAKKIEELSKLKESLLEKETELKCREAAALEKMEEPSKHGNSELNSIGKDYDLVQFSEVNGASNGDERQRLIIINKQRSREHMIQESPMEAIDKHLMGERAAIHKVAHRVEGERNVEKESEFKMWDSYKIEKSEVSPERETELDSVEEEVDSKAESSENMDQYSNGFSLTDHTEDSGNLLKGTT